MKCLNINQISKIYLPFFLLWLFSHFITSRVVAQSVSFCSFRQLSPGKETPVVQDLKMNPSLLLKSDKHLVLRQVGDLKFCVDLKHSMWYFDIAKNMQRCGTCQFDFNEDIFHTSY